MVSLLAIGVLLLAFDALTGGPLSSTGLESVLVVSGVWLLFAGMLLAVISGLDYLRAAWPILAGEDLAGEDPPAT